MTETATFPVTYRTTEGRLTRLARIGVWASTAALLMAIVALVVTLWFAATGSTALAAEILRDFGLDTHLSSLTPLLLWIGTVFWCLVDVLGVIMLWNIRALFRTYMAGTVFSSAAALRLRRIGWIVLAMAPVSMLGEILGGIALSLVALEGTVHGHVSLEDGDVYAIIIGLVLVAAGHMMALASEIDAENREFI